MAERILLIVESPNKIKSLQSFLPKNYIVMASVGHVTELKDGGSYFNTGIDPNNKFKVTYAVDPDKKDVVSKLKEQVRLADKVILCSDPDREGEAIAWSLKEVLDIPAKKYERATFHEITESAVLKAIDNPRKIDKDLVDAAHARQKIDKMLGYRLSQIARNEVDAKSVGRCQSAGLKLIVDREREIEDFIPETYGEITLCFTKDGVPFKAKYFGESGKEVKRPTVEYCEGIIKDTLSKGINGSPLYVREVVHKNKNSNPKPPFTTSTFQQEVSSKLGISVETAMKYAQKLFEGLDVNGQHIALITYIRTDSTELAEEFIPLLKDYVINTYGKEYYAPLRKVKKGENVQDGHEAIRPVNLGMTPEDLAKKLTDKNLVKVYEIIYNRTVAAMMAPAVTSETTYVISCDTHDYHMVSRELTFDGYRKAYNYKEKDDDELITATLEEGYQLGKGNNIEFNLDEKQTQPPSRFKEATFIKELEATGIGRPSTFATILKTIKDESRGYCEVNKDGCLVPTYKGTELSDFLEEYFSNLININYTSEMEKELDEIATGKMTEIDFLTNFYNTLEETVDESGLGVNFSKVKEMKCPKCGAPMVLRNGYYGPFYGCSKYPKCKEIVKIGDDK